MNEQYDLRPDPDELLTSLKLEEERSKRGKLKIFFGMCAGVGKTYSMLKSAAVEAEKGVDIVVGYVETHGRKETEALLNGFEIISRKNVLYKETSLPEMDIDAIIQRKPNTVLVDELAHTNAPGSRHNKRFQDVLEILDNGIDVYTTLNVQHLESRADTVAQITGIVIRETLPDEIFEKADEVELIDITTKELLIRLTEGKVYAEERSREALLNFFREGNITALREMSLRIVADRVDKQLRDYMQLKRIRGPWKSGLHLMVVIGPNQQSAKLIRWAKNLSYTMSASLMALYVETPRPLNDPQNEQLTKNINLARQLGAEVVTTSDNDLVKAILTVASKENITHIVVGKPRTRNLLSLLQLGSFVQRLIKNSGNIDVYVLGSDLQSDISYKRYIAFPSYTSKPIQYFISALAVIIPSFLMFHLSHAIGYQVVSLVMMFIVSLLATVFGIGPILLAAFLSTAIWDYFFIPPHFTLHIEKPEDALTCIMFFVIALINGVLTTRVRRQQKLTKDREERTNALFQLTKELSLATNLDEVLSISKKRIKKHFDVEPIFILQDGQGKLQEYNAFTENEYSVASWSYRYCKNAGHFTDTLPSSKHTFYPLYGATLKTGVVAIELAARLKGDKELFWDTFITQISNAIEREFLNKIARRAQLLNESDKLYNTLFNSISHEFRIPVATIMGASDALMSQDYPQEIQKEFYGEINKASERLNRLIENLLNMSRLESGRITPRFEWCEVNDLANEVVKNLQKELEEYNVEVVISPDTPMVKLDFGLTEQVLYNLVYNATQHTPKGSTIRLKFFFDNDTLTILVMDRGEGFKYPDIAHIFDKFYRGTDAKPGGMGLGLSIVKGFIEAQGGTVSAENRTNGGARFVIKMPSPVPNINLE
ncbi:sensor histidine kinase [Alistipes sp. ZOR0009]|uniref:sensor histidine kinase n=1 Tax=Alistipes sp. ZOR0009 TaxID=1339253 RepID=UPI0006476FA0|nr:sensor histidine kinase KdpD [Alistipes sp. ZOR0009]